MNEETIDLKQELDKLEVIKRDFIDAAAHELNTPLTTSLGFLEHLLDARRKDIPKDIINIIETVYASNRRLAEIAEDLLDIAMIDSNLFILNFSFVHLNQVLLEVQEKMIPVLHSRNITLNMEVQEDIPELISDNEKLRKIVCHLMVNAIKFTPDRGFITLTARSLYRAHRYWLQVTIRDSGIGIPKSDREAVFSSFYSSHGIMNRAANRVASQSAGAGLGLTVCRKLLSILEGRIWFEDTQDDSTPDIGTIIHFEVPLTPDHEELYD